MQETGWEEIERADRPLVHAGEEWRSELYRIACSQFDRAVAVLEIEHEVAVTLREPRRSLTVNFPVRMDDGSVRMLIGYRVQHQLHMGPTKDGFRYAPGVSLGECVEGFPGGAPVGRAEVLETPCDILVPAALERQITTENAERLDCSLVVEAANGPTTPEAEEILARRGILVVPDVLANAGGVTVSYFEWVQDQQKYLWDMIEMQERLRRQMRAALARVMEAADRLDVDWRTAALTVAVDRVARAARLRAIYP